MQSLDFTFDSSVLFIIKEKDHFVLPSAQSKRIQKKKKENKKKWNPKKFIPKIVK